MEHGARLFYASSKHLKEFDIERFSRTWRTLIESDIGVIYAVFDGDNPVGAIGGIRYPDPNSGHMIAAEFFWFVSPEHRGTGMELYHLFERWAQESGCKYIQMVHLTDSMETRLPVIYKRLGYEAVETRYQKEL